MNMKEFAQLLKDVQDVVNDYDGTVFNFTNTGAVPYIDDEDLTFGNREEKKGKHIKTCVLYVDIRNSVELAHSHSIEKMGTVFSLFTQSVQMAAIRSNGRIRNIIGDRVMVVFPEENCFQSAVDCAISVNHLMNLVLNKKLHGIDFQCGIGIDYGDMYCIKVGMPKRGNEREDNRRLVWVGLPANHASRLTDNANKEYSEPLYKVINYLKRKSNLFPFDYMNPEYTIQQNEQEMSSEDAFKEIMDGRSQQIVPLSKAAAYKYSPILITERVYNELKKACPNYNSIKNGWWTIQKRKIRNIDCKVYGADLIWEL